jgi:hypothetical protein
MLGFMSLSEMQKGPAYGGASCDLMTLRAGAYRASRYF